jgi:hypothetical protein
MVRDKL